MDNWVRNRKLRYGDAKGIGMDVMDGMDGMDGMDAPPGQGTGSMSSMVHSVHVVHVVHSGVSTMLRSPSTVPLPTRLGAQR